MIADWQFMTADWQFRIADRQFWIVCKFLNTTLTQGQLFIGSYLGLLIENSGLLNGNAGLLIGN